MFLRPRFVGTAFGTALLGFVIFAVAHSAHQQMGRLEGSISAPGGTPASNVVIELRFEEPSGILRARPSSANSQTEPLRNSGLRIFPDSSGKFSVSLGQGLWTASASLNGLPSPQTTILIHPGQTTVFSFHLLNSSRK